MSGQKDAAEPAMTEKIKDVAMEEPVAAKKALFTPYYSTARTFRDIDWVYDITGLPEEDLRPALGSIVVCDGFREDFVQGRRIPKLSLKRVELPPEEDDEEDDESDYDSDDEEYEEKERARAQKAAEKAAEKAEKRRAAIREAAGRATRTTDCGACALVSLGEMYEEVERRVAAGQAVRDKKDCTFVFITRLDNESIGYADVAALQATAENEGALFQAASNFNGVESVSDQYAPDIGNFLTYYVYDRTQGPSASVSAGGAAITRCVAAFYSEENAGRPEEWDQNAGRQVEMLGDAEIRRYFSVRNGYVVNTGAEEVIPAKSTPNYRAALNKVRVVAHLDAQVTSGGRACCGAQAVDVPRKVSQVFCAAMNIGQGDTGAFNKTLPGWEEKAEFLLRAAYEGTYLAAICNGCKQLYLTLIGGGVFGNPQETIHEIIAETHELMTSNYNLSLEKVYLSYFTPPNAGLFKSICTYMEETGCPYEHYNCLKNEAFLEKKFIPVF